MFRPRRRPRWRPRRLIKFAPAIVSTTVVTLVYSWFATSLPAEHGNVLRQRLKNPGLDCRRINMTSGVHTQIKQEHTTLHRSVVCIRIRDHRQLLAAACHNLLKRHGSPTSTYNWNTPNIYIYIHACTDVCSENNFPSSFVRWIPFYYDWRTINDDRARGIKNRPSTKSPSPLGE